MEELLRAAFTLGQQWVQDMNNDKDPVSFNDWFNDYAQQQLKILNIQRVINLVCPKCGNTGRCEPRTLSDPDGQECDCRKLIYNVNNKH